MQLIRNSWVLPLPYFVLQTSLTAERKHYEEMSELWKNLYALNMFKQLSINRCLEATYVLTCSITTKHRVSSTHYSHDIVILIVAPGSDIYSRESLTLFLRPATLYMHNNHPIYLCIVSHWLVYVNVSTKQSEMMFRWKLCVVVDIPHFYLSKKNLS